MQKILNCKKYLTNNHTRTIILIRLPDNYTGSFKPVYMYLSILLMVRLDEKQTFDEQLYVSLYVDCMLGSLARHLRFYGFDVLYKIGLTHHEMELEAKKLNVPLITTAKSLIIRKY